MTLAAPGGAGELRALSGRLLSRPLDMDRPLWRMARIDGLAGGGWALVGQAHHALVDGIAAIQVALLLFDGVETATVVLDPAAGGRRRARGAGRLRRARPEPWAERCVARRSRRVRCARPPRRSDGPHRSPR